MRDEVKLMTAYGCTKIVEAPYGGYRFRIPIHIGRNYTVSNLENGPGGNSRYITRDFEYQEEEDSVTGHRIYREIVNRVDTPAQYDKLRQDYAELSVSARKLGEQYRSLWNSIYKVDEGL